MRSPATAFAWEFGRRHRWGFLAVGAYLVALIIIRVIALSAGSPLFAQWGIAFAFAVVVPGGAAFYWLVAAFTYGHEGNIAGRRSLFPSRLLTLPLGESTLVRWAMLYGAAWVTLLWIATRLIAPWPAELSASVPYLWPGLLAMVLLAWTQAIVWAPYPLPGLRVALAVAWLAAVEVVSVIAMERGASEPLMLALLAPQLPLAYLAAKHAVARARRGEAADWTAGLERLGAAIAPRRLAQRPFANAGTAQAWIEWRRFGRSLPLAVAILLPIELWILWAGRDAPAFIFSVLLVVVLTPPVMASFTAFAARGSGDRGDYRLGPFTAARPLTSAALVGARLRVALWSTTLAWVLVIGAVPAALWLSGAWPIVADRALRFAGVVGMPRAALFGALVLAALVLTTWRQMVQSLYIGLTGRPGLIKGSAFGMLGLVVVVTLLIDWAWTGPLRPWFWVALYSVLGSVVFARTVLGCWIAARLLRDRLLTDRALVRGAVLWLGAVAAVYGLLLWLFATPFAPRFLLLMLATVTVPLVRLSAAPLALAWNRHR